VKQDLMICPHCGRWQGHPRIYTTKMLEADRAAFAIRLRRWRSEATALGTPMKSRKLSDWIVLARSWLRG
jgi:hypothetical protein